MRRGGRSCLRPQGFLLGPDQIFGSRALESNSEYIQNKIGIAYSQLKYYPEATGAFQRAIGLIPSTHIPTTISVPCTSPPSTRRGGAELQESAEPEPECCSFHVNLELSTSRTRSSTRAGGMAQRARDRSQRAFQVRRHKSLCGHRQELKQREELLPGPALCLHGDVIHALESLRLALNAGFTDIAAIKSEKDFDPIRNDERFLQFMKTTELLNRP